MGVTLGDQIFCLAARLPAAGGPLAQVISEPRINGSVSQTYAMAAILPLRAVR
jgi:hypothetical protein